MPIRMSAEPTPTPGSTKAVGPSEPPAGLPYQITSVFQPIVDLLTGCPIGYEVLSRSEAQAESAGELFALARRNADVWNVERECRRVALLRIAEVRRGRENLLFFLNVSPDVIEDPRFVQDFTAARLRRYGLDPSAMVLEVTENQSISDHERFAGIVTHFTSHGMQFAVDDFGAGHSSLLALLTCAPRFIKLDGAVVRDIHLHSYRRHLVRSLNAFASSVDSRLVAEGVEQWEELEALVRLGVRYAQGFLLARPAPDPPSLPEDVVYRLRNSLRAAEGSFGDPEEQIDTLVEAVETLPVGSITVEELDGFFRDRPGIDHVVLVQGTHPRGLVTREDLAARLAGRYAYALRQMKPAELAAKSHALVVTNEAKVTTLASHAMERASRDVYDPVIVVDAQGALVGTITIKSLIKRSIELQVRSAQGANPLSGLPGNRAIQRWIETAQGMPDVAVLYADLDRFKEYNDRYGFLMGDEMIRLAARVLSRMVGTCDSGRLGHIGGDDFVAVLPDGLDADAVQRACAEFDEGKRSLLDAEDLARGHLVAKNRRGQVEDVPIVTISIAVIERSKLPDALHPALLSHRAASLKATAKRKTAEERRSAFVVERRGYGGDA